jgi:hypothetical protein
MEWSGGENLESRSPRSSPTLSIRQCHARQLLTLQESDDSIINLNVLPESSTTRRKPMKPQVLGTSSLLHLLSMLRLHDDTRFAPARVPPPHTLAPTSLCAFDVKEASTQADTGTSIQKAYLL